MVKRWIAVFDNHGDQADERAVAVLWEFMRTWKPEIRIHGGDNFDFRPFRRKASDQERREATGDDFEVGCEFLRLFKPTHFLRGNHDERMWDMAKSDDGPIADYAQRTIKDIQTCLPADCQIYPYDKRSGVARIGRMHVVHGYSAGVYATRLLAQVYGAAIMGHTHAVDQYSVPRLHREVGRSCGCLCKLDMEYNRGHIQTLRQEHGFAYGILLRDGSFHMWQAMPIHGRWYFPTEIKEVKV
jgi:predicted phosphodiesterase